MKMNRLMALALALMLLLTAGMSALAEEGKIWMKGDAGETVTKIQSRLMELGYLDQDPTGIFDEETEKALTRFQNWNGLLATGMADARTLEVLFSESAAAWAVDTDDRYAEYAEEEIFDGLANYAPAAGFVMAASSPAAGSVMESSWKIGRAHV